jgi:hypothetical protein
MRRYEASASLLVCTNPMIMADSSQSTRTFSNTTARRPWTGHSRSQSGSKAAQEGLPVVNAEIPTIFSFMQVAALQLTFTHPTRTVSIKPSHLRKRCKSMVFAGSYGEAVVD